MDSAQEVEHSLHALKIHHSTDEIARLFQRLDRDHNGYVTFDEWTVRSHLLLLLLR
jgi:Ca2+-binding EF-hand superfamily protein